jgi:hypothetical protein
MKICPAHQDYDTHPGPVSGHQYRTLFSREAVLLPRYHPIRRMHRMGALILEEYPERRMGVVQ